MAITDIESPTLVISADKGEDCILVQKCKLLAVTGPYQGKEFIVDKELFTIGSGPRNDLVIDDSTISRHHCEIELSTTGYKIRDQGSTNGTIVQGVRVSEAYLKEGTEFQLGKTKIIFCPLKESKRYELSNDTSYGDIIGQSIAMRRLFHQANTYAPTDATILIEGETGTGKDLLAEEIHKHSLRKDKPFIVIDCTSLSRELVESELFGHKKGSFTGAMADRVGAFEHASGGTVFLDEIGDLSPELQPKLLRVLEKKQVRPVGSNDPKKVDVRIITATNKKLENEVNAGRFREDLYFRLSVVHIDLVPLRKRKEDIALLTEHFLKDFHGDNALSKITDFDKIIESFNAYDWPGNIRELRNLIEIAFYGKQGPVDLSSFLYLGKIKDQGDAIESEVNINQPFKEAKGELVNAFENKYISNLLEKFNGNVSAAARDAGIERAYLQKLAKKYGLK